MIVRIVKLTIEPQHRKSFADFYGNAQHNIKQFNGCIDLQLFNDAKDENVFFTLSRWQSENDLNHYRYSDFFKKVWQTVKPMFAAKAEAYSLISVSESNTNR
ncbi:MAG: antibiotic biosynthesis monooxygenase [Bacteroidia bacterium]|nr:antibiotic biosynthesis monooxygenase [Bacteroidia bacterium]